MSSSLFAQNGAIKGSITDASSGEPLAGASVVLANINRGTAANSLGKFALQNLENGEYELSISFVGFENSTQKVSVVAGESTQLTS